MYSGDRCHAKIWSWQRANRERFRMRIEFALSPPVAARICFLRIAKTRTRLISRLRRSTIRHRLRRKKRSSSKINCHGLSSTNQSRHSRQSRRRSLTTDWHGFLDRWIGLSSRQCPCAEEQDQNQATTSRICERVEDNALHQEATLSRSETPLIPRLLLLVSL